MATELPLDSDGFCVIELPRDSAAGFSWKELPLDKGARLECIWLGPRLLCTLPAGVDTWLLMVGSSDASRMGWKLRA